MGKGQGIRQREKNYQELYQEVERRAYLAATPCQTCGHCYPISGTNMPVLSILQAVINVQPMLNSI